MKKIPENQLLLGIDPRANQQNLAAGIARRDAGLDRVEDKGWSFVEHMRDIATQIAEKHGDVTVNDLRAYAYLRNIRPHHPNAWGAIFRAQCFYPIGLTKAVNPSSHARRIVRWGLRAKRGNNNA